MAGRWSESTIAPVRAAKAGTLRRRPRRHRKRYPDTGRDRLIQRVDAASARSYAPVPGASSNGGPREGSIARVSGSEFAFLALGLMLGAATGAAAVFVYRSRPPSREVRLTVTHSAVPTRAMTLSSEALLERSRDPAPGGPGDRRQSDRGPAAGGVDRRGGGGLERPASAPSAGHGTAESRTPVRSGPGVAVAIQPEPDRALDFLRSGRATRPLVERMLGGDHRAMLTAVDAIAGDDGATRRTWEELLAGLVEALDERAIDLGYLDFPMGAPFWDTFTIQQCRRIAATLATMGFRFDGREGWQDARAPSYRDLSTAVAEAGIEPRRVRNWPNSLEIGELYRNVRPAPAELVSAFAPALDTKSLWELLGPRADAFEGLWLTWEPVRRVLLEGDPATVA